MHYILFPIHKSQFYFGILLFSKKGNTYAMIRGFSCILIMDENQNRVYSGGKSCDIQGELEVITRQTIRSGIKTTRFFGSTWWGVWKQGQDMIISAPLIREGRVVGGSSVALSLAGVYEVLKRSQYVLLIYILVNTVVFTFIGF